MLSKDNIGKMMKYRWVIFAVLALVYFFVYFHRVSPAVMAGDLMTTFGVGATSRVYSDQFTFMHMH